MKVKDVKCAIRLLLEIRLEVRYLGEFLYLRMQIYCYRARAVTVSC